MMKPDIVEADRYAYEYFDDIDAKKIHLAGQAHALKRCEDVLDFVEMTLEHALALGYLGEGSTNGMAKEALEKIAKLRGDK
jgi:hypothetical protein